MEKTEKLMYAIIDAASMEGMAKSAMASMVQTYGRKTFDGYMVTQYGHSPVMFLELLRKEGPIVDIIGSLADRYHLYPAYIVEEHKSHLPKEAKYPRYIVDQAVMLFEKQDIREWIEKFIHVAKEVYRNSSTFMKAFVYDDNGILRVAMFNSERDPMYRGSNLGVPQWHDAVTYLAKELGTEPDFRTIRYANF